MLHKHELFIILYMLFLLIDLCRSCILCKLVWFELYIVYKCGVCFTYIVIELYMKIYNVVLCTGSNWYRLQSPFAVLTWLNLSYKLVFYCNVRSLYNCIFWGGRKKFSFESILHRKSISSLLLHFHFPPVHLSWMKITLFHHITRCLQLLRDNLS